MDRSVHYTFAITCLLALVLLGMKMNAPKPCVEPGIVYSPEFPKLGDAVVFKSTGTDSSGVHWDFGDGTEGKDGIISSHSYDKPGKYTVMAKTAQGCMAAKVVTIPPNEPEARSVFPVIKISSTTVYVGDRVLIEDQTPGANTWNWSLGENEQESVSQRVSIAYATPGKKEITLTVKGDGIIGTGSSVITVRPKPGVPAPPPVPVRPSVSYKYDQVWSPKLKDAANSNNRENAFRPLVKLFCNNLTTHVKLNVAVLDPQSYTFYDFKTKLINDEQSNWVVDSVFIKWKIESGDRCMDDIYFMIRSRK